MNRLFTESEVLSFADIAVAHAQGKLRERYCNVHVELIDLFNVWKNAKIRSDECFGNDINLED